MGSFTRSVVAVTALALLAGCSKHKSGASDADDMGMHASMTAGADGTVYAAYYWRSHRLSATQTEKVGALMFTSGKVGTDGYVEWKKPETVDGDVRIEGQSDVGLYTSIKLGSDGFARISYYDKKNGDLKLATQTGNHRWDVETVDAAGNVGGYSSLVLENDKPRISYYDFDAHALKFAAKNGTTWSKLVVDDGDAGARDVGKWCSLASDGNGNLGIAYYDATNGDLGYIVGTAAGFPAAAQSAEWIDTTGDVGRWPELAYDLGAPRIAYQDYTNQHLKFAKKDGQGAWSTETVDATQWTGADTSLAIDPTGKITIAYFDGLNNDLLAAHYDGSAWTTSKVATDGANGYFNNVVLDPQQKPIYGWYTFTGNTFIAHAGDVPAPTPGS